MTRRQKIREILSSPARRRRMMVPAIRALQVREGITTTLQDAERAYYAALDPDQRALYEALVASEAARSSVFCCEACVSDYTYRSATALLDDDD